MIYEIPTEKTELLLLPPDRLYKALPCLISSDTWLCSNTARWSCDESLTSSCKPFHRRQWPPACCPAPGAHSSPLGPPRLQGHRVGGELEAQTKTVPPNHGTKHLASEPSTSSSSIWPIQGRAASHREKHNKPPEKGVSRSALSKNRVFSGHGIERQPAKKRCGLHF